MKSAIIELDCRLVIPERKEFFWNSKKMMFEEISVLLKVKFSNPNHLPLWNHSKVRRKIKTEGRVRKEAIFALKL